MNLREEKFSLKRVELLLRRDVADGYRNILVVIGAIAAILITFDVLNFTIFNGGIDEEHHIGTFGMILIIGGFIATSSIFKEVHRRESAHGYLMLPASPLEKVVSRILLSNIGWILLTVVWYSLYSFISAGVTVLITDQHHPIFNPLHTQVLLVSAHYIVLQSIFLVGAVCFRKGHLFKTLLTLFIVGVLFSILTTIALRIIFAPYFNGFFAVDQAQMIGPLFENLPFRFAGSIELLETVRNVVYWALLAPVAWIITYTRFREVQIKDAV